MRSLEAKRQPSFSYSLIFQISKSHFMIKYIKPSIQVDEAQAALMLAESLAINGDTKVDGGDALAKESAWDIWTDE